MITKAITALAFTLLLGKTHAGDDVTSKTVQDAEGCSLASNLASTTGFKVRMFEFGLWDYINFNNDDWFANSYTTQSCSTTLESITEPNFSLEFDLFQPETELYGVYNKYDHFLNEYTGYFLGTLLFQNLYFLA